MSQELVLQRPKAGELAFECSFNCVKIYFQNEEEARKFFMALDWAERKGSYVKIGFGG